MKSPRAFMQSTTTRSILKRPAPLPLSPNPLPFAASFSVVINSSHLSPHVHFPSSPSMAATFAAYSANTYDRGAIAISPGSAGFSAWANRPLSPSAHNAFKLLDPPKRKATNTPATPYKTKAQMLSVPTFEDPRSPKPYKPRANEILPNQTLTVPAFEDPRSPKPYKARTGVSFDELTLHVPRNNREAKELAKSLSTYPRSPYPSAPIEEDGDIADRGRFPTRPAKAAKPQPPNRSRSVENKTTKRHRNIPMHVASPLKQNFLSSEESSRRVAIAVTKPAPLDLEGESLREAFWQSVSLEEPESAYLTAHEMLEGPQSPVPNMMFGSNDGSLWSPRVPKKDMRRALGAEISMLSPAQRITFSKGMVASPSPNDPFAAFPSFSVALMGMDGIIPYPPRVRVA